MKEIVVISGKGGTGKTTLVASFAALAKDKVIADCDVDAADLYILLNPKVKKRKEFTAGKKAFINKKLCTECGKCIELCRFDAISKDYVIDRIACEGCGVCVHFCPESAIQFKDNICGEWFISDTSYGPLVHAKLGIVQENSGKLVSLVRYTAKAIADEKNSKWIIVDGPPGIGCPVISSITQSDYVLIVAEPTLSAMHDMERAIKLAEFFKIRSGVCVNKYDINLDMTSEIKNYCRDKHIDFIGKIPFDSIVTKALVNKKSVVEYSKGKITEEIENIWKNVQRAVNKQENKNANL